MSQNHMDGNPGMTRGKLATRVQIGHGKHKAAPGNPGMPTLNGHAAMTGGKLATRVQTCRQSRHTRRRGQICNRTSEWTTSER